MSLVSSRLLEAFELPDDAEEGEKVRFQRRVLFHRAPLSEAGFGKPPQKQAKLKGLFNEGLRKLYDSERKKSQKNINPAPRFSKEFASWTEVAQ
jgi:hypothetical protein